MIDGDCPSRAASRAQRALWFMRGASALDGRFSLLRENQDRCGVTRVILQCIRGDGGRHQIHYESSSRPSTAGTGPDAGMKLRRGRKRQQMRHVSSLRNSASARQRDDKHWIYYPEEACFTHLVQGNASPTTIPPEGSDGPARSPTLGQTLPCDGETNDRPVQRDASRRMIRRETSWRAPGG